MKKFDLGPGPWIQEGRSSADRFKRTCSNMDQPGGAVPISERLSERGWTNSNCKAALLARFAIHCHLLRFQLLEVLIRDSVEFLYEPRWVEQESNCFSTPAN